ncbi:D-galactarate dehydratase [Aliiroseovarius crassostreae]|uniref:D-galactarate dehydratase n=1 Tax=Aliiroseovarius crassostreae TaxID=154981 RepID=A0A9Q9HGU0_9RHOB|nr:D-galactarate dehydratase [Aliiroseovarius crassostreae]UWP91130.1 D-galactarate dehydratase [Aliiroseovarius crassostreae]UWP96922.1 D-galactarate dehydratase [Aliiroseovarius crassostreae]UWP97441.1 D-galactarate dehydratase [Aliiroseovarius crassostreae]UWQ00598.1 D-galactarate dehydratase [Aliiroseovarius crassostreae]
MPPPPQGAVTVEQFDTASNEARQEAVAAAPVSNARLGSTIATLGDVAQPGFWLETPLVKSVQEGRVTSKQTGRTVKVELRPIPGPAGGGSRLSLSALRLLDLPLAGLHEVEVSDL